MPTVHIYLGFSLVLLEIQAKSVAAEAEKALARLDSLRNQLAVLLLLQFEVVETAKLGVGHKVMIDHRLQGSDERTDVQVRSWGRCLVELIVAGT